MDSFTPSRSSLYVMQMCVVFTTPWRRALNVSLKSTPGPSIVVPRTAPLTWTESDVTPALYHQKNLMSEAACGSGPSSTLMIRITDESNVTATLYPMRLVIPAGTQIPISKTAPSGCHVESGHTESVSAKSGASAVGFEAGIDARATMIRMPTKIASRVLFIPFPLLSSSNQYEFRFERSNLRLRHGEVHTGGHFFSVFVSPVPHEPF